MTHRYFLVFFLSVIFANCAFAEDIVVIVNPKNNVEKLSRDEVLDIFMGRNRKMSSGLTALPLDLPETEVEKEDFYLHLTGKSMNQINSYWARLVLTGHASPPTLLRNQDEVIKKVIDNRNAVGYVSRSKINSQVKVVFEFSEK